MSRRVFFVAPWIALAVLLGPLPSAAAADCKVWQLPAKFNLAQENGFTVLFELDDVVDGRTSGRASYLTGQNSVEGHATATFDGRVLSIEVSWQDDALGQYEGWVDSGGNVAGDTRNLSQAGSQAVRWRSKQIFKCAALPPPPVEVVTPPSSEKPRDFDPTAPASGLAGIWDTITSAGGRFTLSLDKDGNRITGSFGHAEAQYGGTLEGTLNNAENVLSFTFNQPQLGVTGQGTFRLVSRDAIDGRFTVNEGANNVFMWTGTRRP